MLQEHWHIQMLGGLKLHHSSRAIDRFQTRKTGLLLAYLAFYPNRLHSREELVEQLWPESEPSAARTNLRVALTSLRRLLEPPGTPPGSVLITDRANLRLNPAAVITDVAEMEAAFKAAGRAGEMAEQERLLTQAIDLYRGDLLPGFYEDWVISERERLAGVYLCMLHQLAGILDDAGKLERALDYARRAVSADGLQEEGHHQLIRLFMATGQPGAALRQYRQLERILEEQFGQAPSAATRALMAGLEKRSIYEAQAEMPRRAKAAPPKASSALLNQQADMDLPPPDAPVPRLPLPLTRFFGREAERARLKVMLENAETRLITLTGVGGSGKTRLAVELAKEWVSAFSGLVGFVALTPLTEGSQIYNAILSALRVAPALGLEPKSQVIEHLKRQPSLLILDNFEHLVESGAGIVWNLLQKVPNLTCLVTSRQRLLLAGEQEFPVAPLPVPEEPDTPVRLMAYTGVQMFVNRAQLARPDFQITSANAATVAGICARLEGIPLAIELAASRAWMLTPSQMLSQLEARFAFLVSRHEKEDRHRSLQVTLDWSYGLLAPPLQRLFQNLSVFRGGWTAEAAAAVCQEPMAVEYLEQLRARSLVVVEEGEPEMRYRLLETMREYAHESLSEEEQAALSRRHANHFLRLVEKARPELRGAESIFWLDRLEADHANLRAALRWALGNDLTAALRSGDSLRFFWSLRGHLQEGRAFLEEAIARDAGRKPDSYRARALIAAGHLADIQGDYPAAKRLFEQCAGLSRALMDIHGIAGALCGLGMVVRSQGDLVLARSILNESLALYQELGDSAEIARCYGELGHACDEDHAASRAFHEEALRIYRALNDRVAAATALFYVGSSLYLLGDRTAGGAIYEESLRLHKVLGNLQGIAEALHALAVWARHRGDYASAHRQLRECLQLGRQLESRVIIAGCLRELSCVLFAENGYAGRAAQLFSAAEQIRAEMTGAIETDKRDEYAKHLADMQACLGAESFASAWSEGQAMSMEAAIACALG